jgi:hypothetical protein
MVVNNRQRGLNTAASSYMPELSGFVFEDLKSTGNVRLIRDAEIRNQLYRIYSSHGELTRYSQITQNTKPTYIELAAAHPRCAAESVKIPFLAELRTRLPRESRPGELCGQRAASEPFRQYHKLLNLCRPTSTD